MNKKIKVGAVSAASLLLIAVLVGFVGTGGRKNDNVDSSLRTVTLERGDLVSAVSATGTIYSSESTDVYSSLSYPVKAVYVSVGDRVQQGDVLAELDTANLESDIAQKKASVSSSQASAQQNLAEAKQNLGAYQNSLDSNYDSTLLSAQSSVETAEMDVRNAQLEVDSASSDLSSARRKYRDAKNGEDDEEYSDQQIKDLRDTVSQKEIALEKAQSSLEKAEATLGQKRENLDAVKASNEDTLTTYQGKVASAELGTNYNDQWIAIQKLEADLGDCVVTAPVSGTVTAVQAVEGASGSGLLFVIQDTDSLKILTNIKEYDIDMVQIGDRVVIKTDATGAIEFEGVLSKIAPTSTLTTTGETTSSTDAEYESEVTVSSGSNSLRIGMNTRLSIVTEEKPDIYSVPYEAVKTDESGQSFIFVLNSTEEGAVIESVPVETGMETDLYIEISGEALKDGMEVVKNAQDLEINVAQTGSDEGTESTDMSEAIQSDEDTEDSTAAEGR